MKTQLLYYFKIEQNWAKREDERAGKLDIRKAGFLKVAVKASEAIFWSTPELSEGTFHSSEYLAEETFNFYICRRHSEKSLICWNKAYFMFALAEKKQWTQWGRVINVSHGISHWSYASCPTYCWFYDSLVMYKPGAKASFHLKDSNCFKKRRKKCETESVWQNCHKHQSEKQRQREIIKKSQLAVTLFMCVCVCVCACVCVSPQHVPSAWHITEVPLTRTLASVSLCGLSSP